MSNSCFCIGAIVVLYCAVLFAQINLGFSARDSLTPQRTRYARSLDLLYRKHPSLRNAALSDNMRSLLLSLNRKKRFPHHGRSSKNWRRMPSKLWTYAETTRRAPLININDIESPISKQKSNCKLSLSSDELAVDEYEDRPVSLVRRAAETMSTSLSSSPTTSSTKKADFTVKKRQASEEGSTTCITITAPDGGTTSGNAANVSSAENATTSSPAADGGTTVTTVPAETTPPSDMMPVKNTQAAPMAMATTAGALIADAGNSGAAISPVKISETLDEILEDVESLADHKVTANEDFPCQVNGSWISEAGGVRLEVQTKDDNGTLEVTMEEETGKTNKRTNQAQGFLSNATWVLTGRIPLPKKSMIIINGVNEGENQVATFIGECKGYSRFIQIIWGHWILGKATNSTSESIFSQRVFIDALERVKSKRAEVKESGKKVPAVGPVAASTENHMRLVGGATENHTISMKVATENHTISMETATENKIGDAMDECDKFMANESETPSKANGTEKTVSKMTSNKDIEEVLDDSAKHNPLTEKVSEVSEETAKTTMTSTAVITDTTNVPTTTTTESTTPASSSSIETPSATTEVNLIVTTTSLEELPPSTTPTETPSSKTDLGASKNDITSTTESPFIVSTLTQAPTVTEELSTTTASTEAAFPKTDLPITTISTSESPFIVSTSTQAPTVTEELPTTTALTEAASSKTDLPISTISTSESPFNVSTSTQAPTVTEELPTTTALTEAASSKTDLPISTISTSESSLIVTTASTTEELLTNTTSTGTNMTAGDNTETLACVNIETTKAEESHVGVTDVTGGTTSKTVSTTEECDLDQVRNELHAMANKSDAINITTASNAINSTTDASNSTIIGAPTTECNEEEILNFMAKEKVFTTNTVTIQTVTLAQPLNNTHKATLATESTPSNTTVIDTRNIHTAPVTKNPISGAIVTKLNQLQRNLDRMLGEHNNLVVQEALANKNSESYTLSSNLASRLQKLDQHLIEDIGNNTLESLIIKHDLNNANDSSLRTVHTPNF